MAKRAFPVLVCALSAATGFGQEFRATISGVITDPQAARIPGVKVTAVQIDTGAKFETVSDSDGLYSLPFLPPATYRLTAEASGFKRYQHDGVAAGANERIALDIKLEVGAITETIDVSGEQPILQTATASTGQVIDTQEIDHIPLSGRTPLALAQLAYGVVPTDDPRFTRPFDNAGPSGFSLGGTPARSNELLLDGSPDSTGNNRVAYNPPVDAVAELKVESFQADAAFGHTGGGTVNVVLKSGGNAFHGSLYEFNQNSGLNATPFFTNKNGAKKPVSRFNQYGGSFSGPVLLPKLLDGRNRLFFFFTYEGVKDALPAPSTNTVPTAAERGGDFSALLAQGASYTIYDPLSGVAEGSRIRRVPFANNILPANRISAIARNYLQYYPLPNQPGRGDGQDNYLSNSDGERNTFYNVLGRLDYNISDRNKLYFNIRNNLRTGNGGNALGRAVNDNPTATNGLARLNWGATADDVYTILPTFIVDSRINWTRFVEPQRNFSLGYDPTSLGFPAYIINNASRRVLPRISFSRFTGIGDTAGIDVPFDSFQIFESFTKIVGDHTFKFGADLRLYRESNTNYGYTNGNFVFGNNFTNGPLDNSPTPPLGQDFAAFLLGLPTSGNIEQNASRTSSNKYFAFYFQDDFRVKSNLTLNLGLRYEAETPTVERFDRNVRGFDSASPNPIAAAAIAAYAGNPIPEVPVNQFKVNGGLLFAGPGNRDTYSTPKLNFSPRFGLAWTPSALGTRTVVRTGAGLYYFNYGITGVNQYGFNQSTQLVSTLNGFLTPAATLANPFPNGIPGPTGSSLGLATFLGRGVSYYNPNPSYSVLVSLGVRHPARTGEKCAARSRLHGQQGDQLTSRRPAQRDSRSISERFTGAGPGDD